MTEARFRGLVVAFGLTYVFYYALGFSTGKMPDDVQSVLVHSGHGAVLPADSPLYFVPFVLSLVACIGLLMFAAWGRPLLWVSALASVGLAPLAGVTVMPPLDGFVGSIAWLLQAFILGVSYSQPVAARLAADPDEEPAEEGGEESEGNPDERVVEVYRGSEEAFLAVLESVLIENDIPFSLAADTLQDLFAGGRLGGFNFALGPARLFVRERDEEQVRQIIREIQTQEPSTSAI